MRRNHAILPALVGEPAPMILDHDVNGLDPTSELALTRRLRERVAAGRCAILLARFAPDIVEGQAERAVLLHHTRPLG